MLQSYTEGYKQQDKAMQDKAPAAPESFAALHPEQARRIHDLLATSSPQMMALNLPYWVGCAAILAIDSYNPEQWHKHPQTDRVVADFLQGAQAALRDLDEGWEPPPYPGPRLPTSDGA